MSILWYKEFTGGLDARRMAEATSGGVLIRANNGHITRGGEFEQRAAFVPEYALPPGTVGMAHTPASVVVFGHEEEPDGLPVGVAYQRLQHPDGEALVRVLSTDLYAGKIYAVGEFADGSIHHFYDGVRVTDWFDGRARATFEVTGGAEDIAVAPSGSFEVTGGTNDPANTISSVLIDGVDILGSAVEHTGDNATTAAAIAVQINYFTSTPDYTATSLGQTVYITAADTGPAMNGKAITPTVTGDATTGNSVNLSGGADSATSQMTMLRVDGVALMSGPVVWATSNEATAALIAAAVNGFTSSPDYTASVAGAFVSIAAADPGPEPNGYGVTFEIANGFVVSPASTTMANGADSDNTYQPGEFVKTIGQKVYSTSGPNLHFSGIKDPTHWTTDVVGAGFIDLSTESSGSEQLTAIARYQNFAAVFAARTIQIWAVDPDPALNRQQQVLSNTGTDCPNSVTSFGDVDIFYLADSGLRSLRSRDITSSAATTDIGVPVDDLVVPKLATLTENERHNVIGLIEPRDGRFWLIMKDQIFVFSFFTGAKVSAWSTYDTTYEDQYGEQVSFDVTDAMSFRRRVYLRADDTVYVYGGLETGDAHDNAVAEPWLPYMDADDPARRKQFTGFDAALRGLWEVAAAWDPTNTAAEEKIGIYGSTTYNAARNTIGHSATHLSLRFRSQGTGPHRLGACLVHYIANKDDD